ncbi:P22 phage major capsid protein family protein [Streptomyces yunnanensis]|uniref:P22 coat protein-gene protein 5 n=1 Tax=Streptomyces yunnanensis TaxID=156453 RepID=A0A9X8N4X4_9ACTN|nr:P22 phage major capsid protein family protein [Streptomyces yunnanensis]SHM99669.1 P22 coat protein-gene protein 5 [Streptomyces yunnanensis]
MSNDFYPTGGDVSPGGIAVSNIIAKTSLEVLKRKIVLGNLVTRDAETDFVPGVGSTVNVRVPTKLKAHDVDRGGDMPQDSLDEKVIPVTLDVHGVSQVATNSWDVTLDIKDYVKQVVGPQTEAVAQRIEDRIATEFNTVINSDGTGKDGQGQTLAKALEFDTSKPFHQILIEADQVLGEADVPLENRVLVVNPAFRAWILSDPMMVEDRSTGDPSLIQNGGSRLATNYMGKRFGYDVFLSTAVQGACAFVKEAFTLANVAPGSHAGVGADGRQSQDGYAIRWAKAWDPKKAADVSHLDAFCGAVIMDAKRCIGIKVKSAAPTPPKGS